MLVLGATFLALESSWELLYAGTGDRLGRWLNTPRVRRRLDRGTGVLFVAAGGALAVSAARS
jgi:threonine/homoserine/homoserine lactone efflux protein